MRFKAPNIMPGCWFGFGTTAFYLSLLVLIPLGLLFFKTARMGWDDLLIIATDPRVLAAFKLTVGTALVAALINAVFGPLIAWVLTRYEFYGKSIINLLIDLPFALPTAVAGIA